MLIQLNPNNHYNHGFHNTLLPTCPKNKSSSANFRSKAHIQNIATHAQKPLQVIKTLTGTTWGKQKEILVATYKAVMKPTLEYASSIWSIMASPTSINKLQVIQNAALRACTGCTHDTNIQHLHDETNILPIQKHLQLHASLDAR